MEVADQERNLLVDVPATSFVEVASCSFGVGAVTCTAVEDGRTFTSQGPSSLAVEVKA